MLAGEIGCVGRGLHRAVLGGLTGAQVGLDGLYLIRTKFRLSVHDVVGAAESNGRLGCAR